MAAIIKFGAYERRSMTAYLFLWHVFAFISPALGLALLLWLALRARRARRLGTGAQLAVLLAAGVIVLVAGLVLFGRDGRMPVYAALVLVQGSLAWWLRGARR
jgi:hypothetical protein